MTTSSRILIVDDDPTAIQVLYKALEGMGQLRFAISGPEALAMMADDPVDLVLLDARMPGMDGFAACRALRRDYPHLPVIFVTAAADATHEVEALEAGAVDFVSKPVNPPVVRARVSVHLKLKAQSDRLRLLSTRDPLTGIANRRALEEHLRQEWRRAMRHHQQVALLMIDIDQFKSYNDHYGHIQGDDTLVRVAQTLSSTVTRAGDLVARYGGEEFVVVLPGSTLEVAADLAEKIRLGISALGIPHDHSNARGYITVSIGAACVNPERSTDASSGSTDESGFRMASALFDCADKALYAAKEAGRDQVMTSTACG